MLFNYLRLAYRQLSKTRGFTLLNILGLTLGLTTFLLIVLYVADEWSYDRFNTKADRIYRVVTDMFANGQLNQYAGAAPPVAPILQKNYPQVEQAVRVLPQNVNFRNGNNNQEILEKDVAVVDPGIFSVFTLPMIEGNPATALERPHTVVLTETTAKRYFNSTHIIGRTLTDLDDSSLLTVTGVIRDMPVQAHFHADFFISMRGNGMERINNFFSIYPMSTYVLLKQDANPALLQQKLGSFLYTWDPEYKEYDTTNFFVHVSLFPLTGIHLRSNRKDEISANGSIQYVYILSAIAIFVLLIAAINFMNLSTARSAGRAREVGVRKVLGSPRATLIGQFLSESLLVTALAPHRTFGYSFMDADFDALYRSEQRMGELSVLFSALAIIIACLGLFGLAAYAAEQRTKEIGIRKVLGANVTGIVSLLSRDFLRLIALSILIATPLAWLLFQKWLEGFAYRTTIDAWLFAAAATLILVIAMATTIFQSLRAAVANPVDSLRAE